MNKVLVQRGPSASSREMLSPSSSSGIISNAAGNFNNQGVNRIMADIGVKGKVKQNNVGN